MAISITEFGTGKLFTVSFDNLSVSIADYGATLTRVLYTSKQGITKDLTVGFDSVDDYVKYKTTYFGAVIGRVANRISKSHVIPSDVKDFSPVYNDGDNSLHGGTDGFNCKYFDSMILVNNDDEAVIKFSRLDKDGEEGYPGNLEFSATYTINNKNEITIDFMAISDKATLFSPTHHAYWNLDGEGTSEIFNHKLSVSENDNFVFKNYDDAFDVNKECVLKEVAKLESSTGDCELVVLTNRPCMQIYTGYYLTDTVARGKLYKQYSTICLEPQHKLDDLTTAFLPANKKHSSKIIFKIS